MLRFLLTSLLLGLSARVNADFNHRSQLTLLPQYRALNQKGFSNQDEIFDFFALANTHFEWNQGSWWIEAKPEIRALASRGVGEAQPEGATSQTSQRQLGTRRALLLSADSEAYFDFDRLNTRYTWADGEAFVGRKPISLGVLRFFPVWNKLTLPLIFQPGPEWIENPDVVGANMQIGRFSYRGFWSRGNEPRIDDIALIESRFFGDGVEVQALAGSWWQHSALGAAAAFDAFQSTLRIETLWFSRRAEAPSQWQVGLGFERALSSKWTLVSEALYQSAGISHSQNLTQLPNRFMVLASKFYLLPYLTYQLHPLWTLQAGLLAGFNQPFSSVAMGGFEHSVSDTTSLTLKVKWPISDEQGEFGARRLEDPFGRELGMSSTILLQLENTF